MIKSFYEWYMGWYNTILDEMNIMISLPNELQPIKEDNVVILELFEKIDQSIDAKPYLQQIVEKAKECGVTIYLMPTPRYKYISSEEHRSKITRDYLIDYYSKFGFQMTTDKQYMRL